MNISGAAFKLTNEDILSIINDTVKIPGLNIEKLYINKCFYIFGYYRKLVKIPFKIAIFLVEVGQNKLIYRLEGITVLRCPIFKWIRNLILKKVLKDIGDFGVEYSKGKVIVDLSKLLKNLPIGLNFKFKEIEIRENLVLIETKDININIQGEIIEDKIILESEKNQLEESSKIQIEGKENQESSDKYSLEREKIKSKVPDRYKVFFPYVMLLPDIFALFIRLYRDDRVPLAVKVKCGIIVGYLSSPIDIMFDFIPVIGQMDDLAMAFLVLNMIICEVPENIVKENWEGNEDIIVIVRQVLIYLHKYIGEANIARLIRKSKGLFDRNGTGKICQGET